MKSSFKFRSRFVFQRDRNFVYLVSFFFLSSFIWTLVSPLGSPPDEYVHVQYSWVVTNKPLNEAVTQDTFLIPKSLESASGKRCMVMNAAATTECQNRIQQNNNLVEVPSFTPGYPPAYYYFVGIPLKLGFSENIWYLMRIFSVVLCTGILALALWQIKPYLNSNVYYMLLLSLTPMVSFITGAINPSSLEIVSGISLSILFFKVSMSKSNQLSKSLLFLIFLVGTLLSISKHYSWLFTLSLTAVALLATGGFRNLNLANKFKILLATSVPIFIGYFETRTINGLRSGISNIGIDVLQIEPSSFLTVIQANFVGFDNHIYRAIGEFGYIDHRGLELVNQFWSALFYLVVFFGFLKSKWNFKLALGSLLFTAIALVPVFALRTILNGGYGYQSRYAMALICSIPIIAAINQNSNIFNYLEFRKILLWLVPIGLISSWVISTYRYSHGLPFEILVRENEIYFWWLGQKLSVVLLMLLITYMAMTFFHIKEQFRYLKSDTDSKRINSK